MRIYRENTNFVDSVMTTSLSWSKQEAYDPVKEEKLYLLRLPI